MPITDTSPLSRSTEGSEMIDRVTPSSAPETPVSQPVSQTRQTTSKTPEFKLEAVETLPGGVPATPPAEVLYGLDRAQSVNAELDWRKGATRITADAQT